MNEKKVVEFIYYENALLNEGRYEEWIDLFDEGGTYWAPMNPDQQDPYEEVSLYFDDEELMRNRVSRLRHPRVYAQLPPSKSLRMTGNLDVRIDEASQTAEASGVLFVQEHRPTLPEPFIRVFSARVKYILALHEKGEIKIKNKRVDVLNANDVHDSMFVYF